MAISVTSAGTAAVTTGTIQITLGGSIPSGSLIAAACNDRSSNTIGSQAFTDTAGNTYTSTGIIGAFGGVTTGNINIYYVKNSLSLSSSNTITFTRATGTTTNAAISVLYATGVDQTNPYDSATRNTTNGTANMSTISVTSGTPSVSGELFIYACGTEGGTSAWTVGSGWSAPFDAASSGGASANAVIFGAYQINSGSGALTASPSWTTVKRAGIIILGFKPSTSTVTNSNFLIMF